MFRHARLSGLFLPLALLGASPVLAAVAFPSRTTVATINGTKSDFSDVSLTIFATTQVAAGSSGSRVLDFYTPPGLLGASGSSTGAVLLTPPVVGAFDEVTATVTATGPRWGIVHDRRAICRRSRWIILFAAALFHARRARQSGL